MKALLGLFLLSVLLTSGYSLECETCASQGTTCTGKKQTCPSPLDACLSAVTELTVASTKVSSAIKSCFSKDACKALKPGSGASFGAPGSTVVSFECNNAPVPTGSFFLALSSLLFLKLLW